MKIETHYQTPSYQNVRQASKYTTLGERNLRGLIADGKIKAIRKGRRVILRTIDLDRFLTGGN
jgi:excisionase family DNA binding protein